MSHRLGISWGLNQEQQQVGQGPKNTSTVDEEIYNNKEQNKGSVCKLKLDAIGVSFKSGPDTEMWEPNIYWQSFKQFLIDKSEYTCSWLLFVSY